MVVVGPEAFTAFLAPVKRVQPTFGQHSAAQGHKRTLDKTARAAPPNAAAEKLSVCDKIAARKERTLASLSPKVSNAVRRKQAAENFEPCTCCRPKGAGKKKVRWAPERSLRKVKTYEKYKPQKDIWESALHRSAIDQKLGFVGGGWLSVGYEDFPEDISECDD
ncbi:MAG: hypothetical protein Q9170_004220 [Blastenia crenularia]